MCLTTDDFFLFLSMLPARVIDYMDGIFIVGEAQTVWVFVQNVGWCVS